MGLLLSDGFVYGFVLAVGVLTIVSALLQWAGITWGFIGARGSKGRRPLVGSSLLLGVGFVVMAGTNLIPDGHQPTRGWMIFLDSLTVCLFLGSLVMLAISPRKPGPVNPEHN
jgi:hypothetical protein